MSTTDTPPPDHGPGPRVSGQETRDLGRLRRTTKTSPEGRHIAGVAGGLARHLDIDPVLVRVVLVVLVFFGGSGLLLYGAGWLLIPDEGSERAVIQLEERNRSLALYVAAALAALALLGDTVGSFDFPWPLAIIALVLLLIFGRRDRVKTPDWRPFAGSETGQAVDPLTGPATGYGTGQPTAAYAAAAPDSDTVTAPVRTPLTPPAYVPPAYVPPPNRRRRGPILFWFTLALIALSLGTLGIIDSATGASIPDSAYPALAVGITGAMLVLGAFWGRAGGLILVGLLSTVALVGSVAAHEWDGEGDHVHTIPAVAADLGDSYQIDAGELKVDLTRVSDLPNLDGRHLDLEGRVGTIQVTVPDDVNVTFSGTVHGPGQIEFFNEGHGGINTSLDRTRVAGDDAPTMTIDAELAVGQISVRSE